MCRRLTNSDTDFPRRVSPERLGQGRSSSPIRFVVSTTKGTTTPIGGTRRAGTSDRAAAPPASTDVSTLAFKSHPIPLFFLFFSVFLLLWDWRPHVRSFQAGSRCQSPTQTHEHGPKGVGGHQDNHEGADLQGPQSRADHVQSGLPEAQPARHAARHAGGGQGGSDLTVVEPGRPVAQHLRQGGRSTHVPPPPRGAEHRLHPGARRVHARAPRVGDPLEHATAGHARCRRRGHARRTAPLRWIPITRGLQRRILGLGPRPQQALPRHEKQPRADLPKHFELRRELCRAGQVSRRARHG